MNVSHYFKNTDKYGDLSEELAVSALSGILKFKTVSYSDSSLMDKAEFQKLHAYLKTAFPNVHRVMEKTVINDMSLLFKWNGSNKTIKPALMMAHIDVVPVNEDSLGDWEHPPFSGEVADGFIWGRGASDTKNSAIGYLTAAEYLIGKGFTPKRDIYFALGHDEETLGYKGNYVIGQTLKEQGVELGFLLDEGGSFELGDEFGAPDVLLAKMAIFEKGYVNINVTAKSKGGHSSVPGSGTSLGKVCRAMAKIEEEQFPPRLSEVNIEFIKALAPHVTAEPLKTWFNDIKGHEAELLNWFMGEAHRAAMVHTTTAVNMLSGSPAANVLPETVTGLVNFRMVMGESCEKVLKHCEEAAKGTGVALSIERGIDPKNVADVKSEGVGLLNEVLHEFIPSAVLVPTLTMGGTDAKFYEEICPCCLRFKPYLEMPQDETNYHRVNERTLIEAHIMGTKVFIELMSKL